MDAIKQQQTRYNHKKNKTLKLNHKNIYLTKQSKCDSYHTRIFNYIQKTNIVKNVGSL